MAIPEIIALDFETEGIERRPKYPPKPVGVALKEQNKPGLYMAWGHASGNNCNKVDAIRILKKIWASKIGVCMHHGKFDQDVAETHIGLPRLDWRRYHDTLFLAFLEDPDSATLELKPLSERYLGMKPEERDKLREWILANVPGASQRPSEWAKFIYKAPGTLVGKYAIGDVERTARLFKKLRVSVHTRGMGAAYDRERRLTGHLIDAERRGLNVDLPALRRDVPKLHDQLRASERLAGKLLGVKDLDLAKKGALAEALDGAGVMDSWTITPTGKRSTAKGALLSGIGDSKKAKRVQVVLLYRGALATMLQTFLDKWLAQAEETGGLIYTNWNQTRQAHDDGMVGARTGRLSSNPNFQNIPVRTSPNYERILKLMAATGIDKELPPLPLCRRYVTAGKGRILLKRDYSQQELRILGHFEDGPLLQAYLADPWMDIHTLAQKLINESLGADFGRRAVKDMAFGLLYGMGIALLAEKSGQDIETTKVLKKAYLDIFPGLGALQDDLKQMADNKEPLRTWGSREYFCEPPKVVKGRLRTFGYKMLNRLIQGSAADCTKEAVIRYCEHPKRDADWLLSVHDELEASVAHGTERREMEVLRESMESVEFDVPMLSDGSTGINWAEMKKFNDRRTA